MANIQPAAHRTPAVLAQGGAHGSRQVLLEHPGDQHGARGGFRHVAAPAAQRAHPQEVLEALEDQFHLPACPIPPHHRVGRPVLRRQGGHDQQPPREQARAGSRPAAPLPRRALRARAGPSGLLRRQRGGDPPHRIALALPATPPDPRPRGRPRPPEPGQDVELPPVRVLQGNGGRMDAQDLSLIHI